MNLLFDLPKDYKKEVPDKIISLKQTTVAQENKHAWSLDGEYFCQTNGEYEEYRRSKEI